MAQNDAIPEPAPPPEAESDTLPPPVSQFHAEAAAADADYMATYVPAAPG